MKWKNNPDVDGKYNYLYRIINNINGVEYIGVHRTENLNDGYMGSGKLLKRAIRKYGTENFTKEILQLYPTYKQALLAEKKMVTLEYIESDDNYNLREGGYGRCGWSSECRQKMSQNKRDKWKNDAKFRDKMLTINRSTTRRDKISKSLTGKKRKNPQNKNLDKIRKTAETHKGMKRTAQAKQNMSTAAINAPLDVKRRRSGRGMIYIYNQETAQVKRVSKMSIIPEGWARGTGPKKSDKYKNMNRGSYFAYDPVTYKIKRFQSRESLPVGWKRGRPTKRK